MKRLQKYFEDYASHHRNSMNLACHQLGVPLIEISVLGTLSHSTFQSGWDGGLILVMMATVALVFMDWRLALPFGLTSLGLYFVGGMLSSPILIGAFVLGWVFQLVGHYCFEKRSPAFIKNWIHFWIGPVWLFAKMIGYVFEAQPPRQAG